MSKGGGGCVIFGIGSLAVGLTGKKGDIFTVWCFYPSKLSAEGHQESWVLVLANIAPSRICFLILLMFLSIPASTANQLEKIMSDFFWISNESGNGLHWVNWDEVYRPKQERGLDIRPLRAMIEAFKTKWLGRFAKEDNAMWKNVITAKYGIDDLGWWTKKSSYSHGASFWKYILAERFKSLVHFERRMARGFYFDMMSCVGINL